MANILNFTMNDKENDRIPILNGNSIGHTYLFVIDCFNSDNFPVINTAIEWIEIWKLSQNMVKKH